MIAELETAAYLHQDHTTAIQRQRRKLRKSTHPVQSGLQLSPLFGEIYETLLIASFHGYNIRPERKTTLYIIHSFILFGIKQVIVSGSSICY
jgi:hypothetical protein